MHPKFSIIEKLQEGTIEFVQELSYAKLRIQLNKELELEESEEHEKASPQTPEAEEKAEEDEAKADRHLTP